MVVHVTSYTVGHILVYGWIYACVWLDICLCMVEYMLVYGWIYACVWLDICLDMVVYILVYGWIDACVWLDMVGCQDMVING